MCGADPGESPDRLAGFHDCSTTKILRKPTDTSTRRIIDLIVTAGMTNTGGDVRQQ